MVRVSAVEYDNGASGGDGLPTKETRDVDASTTRVTLRLFDWRDRLSAVDGEVDFYEIYCLDNLDRTIRTDRRDTTAAGNLVARSDAMFDDRGRAYRTIRYGVDPATGTVGKALTDNTWYDDAGNAIKTQPAGSSLSSKAVFDGVGRQTKGYQGYDLSDSSYADATTVVNDTIMEQAETALDAASNSIQTTIRRRYHNATGTGGTGHAQQRAAQGASGILRVVAGRHRQDRCDRQLRHQRRHRLDAPLDDPRPVGQRPRLVHLVRQR